MTTNLDVEFHIRHNFQWTKVPQAVKQVCKLPVFVFNFKYRIKMYYFMADYIPCSLIRIFCIGSLMLCEIICLSKPSFVESNVRAMLIIIDPG